ncbi:MAG: TolC family protein [Halioglobus sp.]
MQAGVRADQLGTVNWTRWLGELDVGVERERESGGGRLAGPSLEWELPLFNQHEDAVVRADTELQIAINEVRRLTLDVDNGVRLAYANLGNARTRITEYQTVLIPQRTRAVALGQQELNFMLTGVFELIAFKQDEYTAYQGYLEAIRDYWLARADLAAATGTSLPGSSGDDQPGASLRPLEATAPVATDHSAHGDMTGMAAGKAHATAHHDLHEGGSQ